MIGPLPPQIKAVLAQRLYGEKAGLPPPLLNQLKRIAAFQNPEFYKKQRMRLSTATTPRGGSRVTSRLDTCTRALRAALRPVL